MRVIFTRVETSFVTGVESEAFEKKKKERSSYMFHPRSYSVWKAPEHEMPKEIEIQKMPEKDERKRAKDFNRRYLKALIVSFLSTMKRDINLQ
jgi:hypothetical protein